MRHRKRERTSMIWDCAYLTTVSKVSKSAKESKIKRCTRFKIQRGGVRRGGGGMSNLIFNRIGFIRIGFTHNFLGRL
jgi:hypothetical protein